MNEKAFLDRIRQTSLPVVVDFWAPWCAPCRLIEPVMKKLEEEYAGRVEVMKINADEHPEVLRGLNIYGIPTLVAYHNGQEVSRRTGAASQGALANLFEAALSGDKPVKKEPAPISRLLRLVIGGALFFLAFQGQFSGFYLLLAILGVIVAFTAVYDRCPIYKAVTSRLKAWLGKEPAEQPGA